MYIHNGYIAKLMMILFDLSYNFVVQITRVTKREEDKEEIYILKIDRYIDIYIIAQGNGRLK